MANIHERWTQEAAVKGWGNLAYGRGDQTGANGEGAVIWPSGNGGWSQESGGDVVNQGTNNVSVEGNSIGGGKTFLDVGQVTRELHGEP